MTEPIIDGIAIIGLHGRFPGAGSVEEFWANLVAGRETISFFSDAELTASGLDPAALRRAGHYVPARGVLKDAECFDAGFFGIHPKEAEVMDPQHRVFLEACWEALERAGYAPGRIQQVVGIYAGATFNTYYLHALHPRPELRELVGHEQVMLGNEKDYLATRVAYKLNLKGPAISLNTACSSSLVAVCQACQSLSTYQCDLALAGGVSVRAPQQEGYFHQEGNIASPDGHTRTFDATAKGTVFSNGVTIVVLKRLAEAVADGDKIYAVIKGSALNNDGSQRVSFGAPGVEGQSEVVTLAQEIAGVEADSISYIEAHGTATPIGDPIEVAALTKAFRRGTKRKQFCALGSVKSNVGHLDAAAGTAGLIKTALALNHQLLPPSLHFENPNPKLDLENSPFFVNSSLREWKSENGSPLVAGVSSFGTGGTNAHIVVEEAPRVEPSGESRPWQLLLLSAKTPEALESATRNLAAHLRGQPEANLADVAYTLQVGRSEFNHRRAVLCQTVSEAIALLEKPDTRKVFTGRQELKEPPVVFMFPGQGAQYVNMGADVYRQERVFREAVDQCAQILQPILGADLRDVLFAPGGDEEAVNEKLRQTRFTQPALFTIEYALAQLWIAWGVKPAAMSGHSVGEYVAGCLAGVFSLEEALMLVARRAELCTGAGAGVHARCATSRAGGSAVVEWRAVDRSDQLAQPVCRFRSGRGGGKTGATDDGEGRCLQGASHFACLPFRDDGSGGGAIYRFAPKDPPESAADSLCLERNRPVDYGGGGNQPGILGRTRPPDRAVLRRCSRIAERPAPHLVGGRTRPDAAPACAAASRPQGGATCRLHLGWFARSGIAKPPCKRGPALARGSRPGLAGLLRTRTPTAHRTAYLSV